MTRPWPADRRIALLCVAAAALCLAMPAAPARGAALGVAADLTWGIPRADADRTISALRRAGVRSVRINASWTGLEPRAKGTRNAHYLADLDYAVRSARTAGLHVLLQVADRAPAWASDRPRLPRNPSDYGDFARFVTARYAPLGVHAYEIWNEPNHPGTWPGGPDPAAYTRLLEAGAEAIRGADRRASVVLGGLSGSDHAYLQDLYDAGAARFFDVVAVHPYTGSVSPSRCWRVDGARAADAFCGLDEIRALMRRNDDARTPVWVTEFGWSTYDGRFGVSEVVQARYMRDAVRRLDARPWVRRAYWYSFRNTWFREQAPGDFLAHYGLLRTDFSAKPAYRTLRRLAHRRSVRRPAARR